MSEEPDSSEPLQPEQLESERDKVRQTTRSQLLAIGLGVVVLIAAALVAVVLLGGDGDDDEIDSGAESPGTTAPGEVPTGDFPGLSTEHPLVGRTELEAREIHPVVRLTWLDGEALMTTMDLVPGRVDLAVQDGTIVAAAAEGCDEVLDGAPAWVTDACNPSPDDAATVFGRLIVSDGDPSELVLEPGFNADRYYEGLSVSTQDIPVMLDMTGAPVTTDDLQAGQSVWIWSSGPCNESFPVECDIDALVVER